MRVTLVDNVLMSYADGRYVFDLQPHLGLISLIAVLRLAGHDATLYDPKLDLAWGTVELGRDFYRTIAERIVATAPDVVGFTSLGCNFVCTVKIAQHTRALRPDIPIVLGGPHASILDREILARYIQFDVIARGEAEATIAAVVAALAGQAPLATVAGLSYRSGGAVVRTVDAGPVLDLEALPFAAYDAYPIAKLGLTELRVDAGRGCPFACTFCSTASFFGRRYRLKSAPKLVAELNRLAAAYGVRSFSLSHDLFTVSKAKVREFCAAVSGRGYDWNCSARMDCVDAALLEEMRGAGCNAIYYGIETGSRRMQTVVGKQLDLDLYHPIFAKTIALGMAPTASFIIGYPNETAADKDETLNLIGETLERYPGELTLQLHLLTPEPGTAMHAQFASTLAYDGHISDYNFPALEADDTAVIGGDKDVFVCHHYFGDDPEREANIAVADGYLELRRLERDVLLALRRADESFAALVREYGAFSRRSAGPAAEKLARYVAARCGDHPLTDAVRYLAAAAKLRIDAGERSSALDPAAPIRLATYVLPLDDIRDGPEVVRRLRRGEPLDSAPLPVACRLLFAAPDLSRRDTFEVDRLTFDIAVNLARGTTLAELETRFARDVVQPRFATLQLLGAVMHA
jgi:radical SAM superfamily enzyme YgiQ (UPF0313 family)